MSRAKPRPAPAGPGSQVYSSPSLIDDRDRGWITTLCTSASLGAGKPWRTLHAQLLALAGKIGDQRVRPRAVASVINAIRQVVTARGSRVTAKQIRALVLGSPALDDQARALRIAAAAAQLDMKPRAVDELMWSDLSNERIVNLGEHEVDPFEVGAAANVDLIARVLRRALHVVLDVHGDPRPFAWVIARRGLLARITRRESEEATRFSIVGPLSLFHATSIYGRALTGIVPYLATLPRWTLVVHLDYGPGPGTVTIESPVELPRAPASTYEQPLATQLEAQGLEVDLDPHPLWSGDRMLIPDFEVLGRPVEVHTFATDEYLADKRAAYAAIGLAPIFVTDNDDVDVVIEQLDLQPPAAPTVIRRRRGAGARRTSSS